MKRHESLHPLSQHHHFVLIEVWELRRALERPETARAEAVNRAAEKLVRFWKQSGQQHFREEEEVLLPAYAKHMPLEQDAEVSRMLADHAAIRALIAKIEAALAASALVHQDVAALAQMLFDHVRLEEDKIFPRMEKILGEDELRALGSGLHRLHSKGSCEV